MRRNRPSARRGLRIVAVLAALSMAAVACSGSEPTNTSATGGDIGADGGDSTTGGEPGAGVERLIYGVRAPQQESNDVVRDVHPNEEYQLKPMYENLIGVDRENAEWIPMLAKSWELNEDGDLHMELQEGVEFHNGFGEFTAKDVVFTYEHLVEPAGALSGVADALRGSVEEIEVVNDHEIIWHLSEPSYAFLEGLSYGASGMAIMSKADFDGRGGEMPGINDEPLAGTGPYQFVSRSQGENVVFERVEDHWRQTAAFPELEYRYMGEQSTLLSALLAGEIHVTELTEDLTTEAGNQGMKVIEAEIPGRRIGMSLLGAYLEPPGEGITNPDSCGNQNDSPMWDRSVRRAINKAIDRDALNEAFFGGRGEHLTMWYWTPETTGWNPEWEEQWDEVYGYDPEAARALLEEAGYGPGELTITVLGTPDSGGPESAEVSEAVAGMLSDVGINAPIEVMDGAQHTEQRESFAFEAAIEFDSTSSEIVTGFEPQGTAFHASGRAVESCEIDDMYLNDVLTQMTPEAQDEPYRELGNVVFEMVQHVPLFRTRLQRVVDPEVVGDYEFPGAGMSAPYSFVEYITAAE